MGEHTVAQEVKYVGEVLEDATKHGLQAEVVRWALDYMKSDPTISIAEAMNYGYDEWIK